MTDTALKLQRVRELLAARELDAILLKRICNFAWLADGASSYVNTAADQGAASLLVTADRQYVLTTNIEATRIGDEEPLRSLGFDFAVDPWYGPSTALAALTDGLRLGADAPHDNATDVGAELNRLRLNLTPAEGERFRTLGRTCADAMNAAIYQVAPGMTEYQIAGLLANETLAREALPIVNLIATDERIFRYRHPLPTAKKLKRYAMLVLCGRQYGLVCSITRLIHFGPLSDELRHKELACARVDATMIARTRPGVTLGQVFQATMDAYAAEGFPGEWRLHHQGGPASYNPREFTATPDSTEVVQEGQVYAWNPSITGLKSEDTILVGAAGNEVLTTIAGWPMVTVNIAGQILTRPAVLVA
ncbi:MAG: M24 family metallopeptidase [Chloroflexi bacterium]|nr:M24 family metallopeptidase [Chloroflexota bacterium]